MATNLGIENLSKQLQIDGAGGGFGGLDTGKGIASESRTIQEMGVQGLEIPSSGTNGATPTFAKIFSESVGKVNEMQVQSDTAIKELVAGRSKNIHETMLTIERADTSLKLMMQVRNKVLDAYREIMRMQV